VGRRGIKEYRAAEALQLILADRDRERLTCPSCGHEIIDRTPRRRLPRERREAYRTVTLRCARCGRQAAYVPHNVTQPSDRQLIGG
jgi:RNase P subunit RPR2